jgi:CO dehydrogenase/acetyl-CoA synthase epsilon subunit
MEQNIAIEFFVKIIEKNNKPTLVISKQISDPEAIKKVVELIKNDKEFVGFVTIKDRFRFIGSLKEQGLIDYDMEKKEYYWVN